MKFIRQSIPDVILIHPQVHEDNRGYFVETFRQDNFEQATGYDVNFIQDNESRSYKGVLRGLHFQLPPFAQSKLVRVIDGEVLDVAVDIRKGSPSFGQHVAVILNDQNKYQVFIPRGFAHGYIVLSESAIYSYKVDNYYAPGNDRGLAFNAAGLDIDWKLPAEQLIISRKDLEQPGLLDLDTGFEYGQNYYA